MTQPNLRHTHILIVEDHLPDIVLIKQFFAHEKISNVVRYARSIKEAQALIEEHRFDICFIDVHLPDGSGFELMHHLKDATMIMLSRDEPMEHLLKAQHLGAVAYIGKPLTKPALDRLIRELKHLHWSIVIESPALD